jgi:hypothetical protein
MYACDGTFTEWNDPTCVPGNVTFTALDPQGYFSDTRENITVTTQAEYDVFLAAHYSGAAPLAIDFNKKALIAVFMGIEPNTCYATDIQEITVDCGDMNSTMNARGWMIYSSLPVITVKIKETYPAPGAMCGQAITRPLKLVLIDRLAGNQLQFFVLPGGPLPAQEGWLPFFSFVYN